MKIKYRITFHSPWHCGSGEARGADLDAVVLRDNEGFPYIPGKTMKGIIKDGMLDSLGRDDPDDTIFRLFGKETKDGNQAEWDGKKGLCHFTDASFSEVFITEINKEPGLCDMLFAKVSSTAINVNGTADDHSLRSIEVVVPSVLFGKILNVPDDSREYFENAFKMVKRMGTGRNRGYGRCKIELIKGDNQ
jgi:CRISPR/Cas system CSM-associated protein Csm3 (group 7 of RAMP superfamily)